MLNKVLCPQVEELPTVRQYISPEKIEAARKSVSQAIVRVSGDCMEGAGIEDGGMVAVDFTRMPRAPKYGKDGYSDPCLCLVAWPGQKSAAVMGKVYSGKWGQHHTVSTKYDNQKAADYRFDVGLFAEKIYGVIFASWSRTGELLWQRDPEEYPESLPDEPTVQCGNAALVEATA